MLICKTCGKSVNENSKFCPKCGSPLNIREEYINEYDSRIYNEKKPNNNVVVVALCVTVLVLVLIISVILAFMWMNNDGDKSQPTQTVTPVHTQTPIPVTPTPIPTPTPTPVPINTHKVFKSNVTWEQANQNALAAGGHLVYVDNAEEFGKVCALANSMNLKAFWLGASRASNQTWESVRWGDGSYITYTYWYNTEPTYYDSNGNEERYLMAFNVNGIWYYNDSMNNVNSVYPGRIGYIVEY